MHPRLTDTCPIWSVILRAMKIFAYRNPRITAETIIWHPFQQWTDESFLTVSVLHSHFSPAVNSYVWGGCSYSILKLIHNRLKTMVQTAKAETAYFLCLRRYYGSREY